MGAEVKGGGGGSGLITTCKYDGERERERRTHRRTDRWSVRERSYAGFTRGPSPNILRGVSEGLSGEAAYLKLN